MAADDGSISKKKKKLIIGWREWVGLPDLGAEVKAKVDTGARTSAIHAWDIELFRQSGKRWVRFNLHPLQRNNEVKIACAVPVLGERAVRSSSGHTEMRLVIRTMLALGASAWPIELTLARRDEMGFRLLIGRTAIRRHAVVDPARSFLCSGKT
jgi:hypothetical protein